MRAPDLRKRAQNPISNAAPDQDWHSRTQESFQTSWLVHLNSTQIEQQANVYFGQAARKCFV